MMGEAARETRAADTAVERCVVLHGLSWATYERLLQEADDSHAMHMSYDRGTLEIMVLSFRHETLNRLLATIVEVLAEELDLDLVNAGSTTFKRPDLYRGFEPDTAFYLQNAARVRGRDEIDLHTDPPPDLVIEVDISHSSLDKTPIYAAVGVGEIWRYDGQAMMILGRGGDGFQGQSPSAVLPGLTDRDLTHFLRQGQVLRRSDWLRELRQWARGRSGS